MSIFVYDCPRCHAKKITFDLISQNPNLIMDYRDVYLEIFCVCRACKKSIILFVQVKNPGAVGPIKEKGLSVVKSAVTDLVDIMHYICIKDMGTKLPPDHLPEKIDAAYREGAACLAIGCPNGAGTMFRLCVDLATRAMIPEDGADSPNKKICRNL